MKKPIGSIFFSTLQVFSILLLINCVTISAGLAQQPTEDVVYFIDGSQITGTILDIDRNFIYLKTKDGRFIKAPTENLYKFSSRRHFREIYRQSIIQNR